MEKGILEYLPRGFKGDSAAEASRGHFLRFEDFLELNDITDPQQINLYFRLTLDSKARVWASELSKNLSLKELRVEFLYKYYHKIGSRTTAFEEFLNFNKKAGQNWAEAIGHLRLINEILEYPELVLIDRVLGLLSRPLRIRLREEETDSLDRIQALITFYEREGLRTQNDEDCTVSRPLSTTFKRRHSRKCYSCGRYGHLAVSCDTRLLLGVPSANRIRKPNKDYTAWEAGRMKAWHVRQDRKRKEIPAQDAKSGTVKWSRISADNIPEVYKCAPFYTVQPEIAFGTASEIKPVLPSISIVQPGSVRSKGTSSTVFKPISMVYRTPEQENICRELLKVQKLNPRKKGKSKVYDYINGKRFRIVHNNIF